MKNSSLLPSVLMLMFAGLVHLSGQSVTSAPGANLPVARPVSPKSSPPEKAPDKFSTPDKPRAFGYKCAWLAIHSEDTKAILEALNLKNPRAANWATGIEQAYGLERVFVTPPVQGWTLVVGLALPEAGGSGHPDQCTPLLRRLSKQLGEVQYFATHRVVEYHAWAKAENGVIARAYAYVGEEGITLWNVGVLTPEEKALGFKFDETHFPNEEDVMKIAGKWSLNPLKLEEMNLQPGVGVVGKL